LSVVISRRSRCGSPGSTCLITLLPDPPR
jgi:hypothetical protein